jgi:hypothetical protein
MKSEFSKEEFSKKQKHLEKFLNSQANQITFSPLVFCNSGKSCATK